MSRMRVIVLVAAAAFILTGCKSQKTSYGPDSAPPPSYLTATEPIANTPPAAPSNPPALAVGNAVPQPAPTDAFPAPAPSTAGGNSYIVRQGDTLWSIATRHYGNGQRYRDIISANPGLNPRKLRVGQSLVMP